MERVSSESMPSSLDRAAPTFFWHDASCSSDRDPETVLTLSSVVEPSMVAGAVTKDAAAVLISEWLLLTDIPSLSCSLNTDGGDKEVALMYGDSCTTIGILEWDDSLSESLSMTGEGCCPWTYSRDRPSSSSSTSSSSCWALRSRISCLCHAIGCPNVQFSPPVPLPLALGSSSRRVIDESARARWTSSRLVALMLWMRDCVRQRMAEREPARERDEELLWELEREDLCEGVLRGMNGRRGLDSSVRRPTTSFLDDADIDAAAKGIVSGALVYSGQVCMSTSRVLVQRGISDALTEKICELCKSLKAGDPYTDPTAKLAALFSEPSAENVLSMFREAIGEGAQVLVGDVSRDGSVIQPHVFTGVKPGTSLWEREVFGPESFRLQPSTQSMKP